jgi:hypothetical protein
MPLLLTGLAIALLIVVGLLIVLSSWSSLRGDRGGSRDASDPPAAASRRKDRTSSPVGDLDPAAQAYWTQGLRRRHRFGWPLHRHHHAA